jgi:hypothetical protein
MCQVVHKAGFDLRESRQLARVDAGIKQSSHHRNIGVADQRHARIVESSRP